MGGSGTRTFGGEGGESRSAGGVSDWKELSTPVACTFASEYCTRLAPRVESPPELVMPESVRKMRSSSTLAIRTCSSKTIENTSLDVFADSARWSRSRRQWGSAVANYDSVSSQPRSSKSRLTVAQEPE